MIYLATQKGINKVESEDAVLIGTQVICDTVGEYAIPQTGFICVADGVGVIICDVQEARVEDTVASNEMILKYFFSFSLVRYRLSVTLRASRSMIFAISDTESEKK